MESTATDVDVIVVGAGPTGLTAAGDLARVGRSVVVLERWPSTNPSSRAFAVMPRTLELLDSRGLADHLLATGAAVGEVRLFGTADLELGRVRSPFPFALITPQTNVDAALAGYASETGARIERDTEVVGLEQDGDGVTVTTRPKDGGPERVWRASYAVAADGAHSTVRDLLGVEFPGRSVLESVVLADVRLAHGPAGGGLTVGSTAEVFGFLAPYGDGVSYRSMTWDRRHQQPDSAPVADGEIEGVMRQAFGRDVGLEEVTWHSRFHCDERQVASYRHGRVFLAGDAAHVHSPVGGQGMNTGIQDAVNLAWKLDAVLGGAADAVLDSYQDERHPIGERVLLMSGTMLRAIVLHPRPARWLRDHVAPLLLRLAPVRNLIAGSFTGVALRYGRRGAVGTNATSRVGLLPPSWALVPERDGSAVLVRPDGYVAWVGASTSGEWRQVLASWGGQLSASRTVA